MANLMLTPSENVYISNKKPDKNFSNSSVLYAGTDMQKSFFRALLCFDLSLLPNDIIIEAAALRMYAGQSSEGTVSGFFTPYAITAGWCEKEVTWDNQPEINLSIAGKTVEVAGTGWHTWDVTHLAQVWILGDDRNHGLMIKSQEREESLDLKKFISVKSYYNRTYRPQMELRYNYKNVYTLGARNTSNSYEFFKTSDLCMSTAWKNTSIYSIYTFFVYNSGSNPVHIHVQVSPDRSAVFNEAAEYIVAPGITEAIVPQRFGFFTRLAYKSVFFNRNTTLKVWFQAQV